MMRRFVTDEEKSVFVADGARVLGDVEIGKNVGIWYNAVVRGDTASITIGDNSNIQDNCTVHGDTGYDVVIGEGVTIGHGVVVHGCTIGDNSLIGMGSILLNGASVGKNCIIGAGSLVTGGTEIPDNSVAFGNPAKVIRNIKSEEILSNKRSAQHYVELIAEHNCLS